MHQAHPVAAVLYAYLVRERSLQGCRLHHIVDGFTNIVDFAFTLATVFFFLQQASVIVAYEDDTTG